MDREIPPWYGAPFPGGGDPGANGGEPAGTLIVALVLASVTMAFGVAVALYLYTWAAAPHWPPPGAPRLPPGLWLSTALLIASGGTMVVALRAARNGRWRRLRRAIAATLVLGVGFLVTQTLNWGVAVAAHMPPGASLYAATFYVLTGLHAAHVLGGLVPLTLVTARAWRGLYSPAHHIGVKWMAMYWHFLGIVWIVLYGVLLAGEGVGS